MSANFAKTMGFKSIREYNSDLYLDTTKSINYEDSLTIKSSFRVEKLTKYHLKRQQKSLKRAQTLREPWDSSLLLNTIEIYIWIHQNQ